MENPILKILTSSVSAELIVKKSKFFAEIFACESPQKAKEILKSQKEKYKDASHVVHAFACGLAKENCGASDDGEPSGTSGKPILAVLKGSPYVNVMLTVTRWFGGTLLGTGGLVKAYSDVAKDVIKKEDESGAWQIYKKQKQFDFSVNYEQYKKIKQIFKSFEIDELRENFLQDVSVSLKIKAEESERFCQTILNITNGKIKL